MLKDCFCVYEETDDGIVVWGLGHTEKEAQLDSVNHIDESVDLKRVFVSECTDSLYEEVDCHGGGGKYCVNEEGLVDITGEKPFYKVVIEKYKSYKKHYNGNVPIRLHEELECYVRTLDMLDVNGYLYEIDESEDELLQIICENILECIEDAKEYRCTN